MTPEEIAEGFDAYEDLLALWDETRPLSDADRETVKARVDTRAEKAKEADLLDVCVCGHLASRHELLGTEYARCLLRPNDGTRCQCQEGCRTAVRVERGGGHLFQRRAKGSSRPHVLDVSIAKYVAAHPNKIVIWDLPYCERCDSPDKVETWTLLEDGTAQPRCSVGNPGDAFGAAGGDTGRHARLCWDCAHPELPLAEIIRRMRE